MTLSQKLQLLAAIIPLIQISSTGKGALHEAVYDLMGSIASDCPDPFKTRINALRDSLFVPVP